MTTYRIEIIAEPAKAEQGIAAVRSALTALDRKTAESIGLMNDIFDDMAAEAKAGTDAASKLATQMEREARILKSINGPMDEYVADVRALNGLWEKGAINAAQYNAQLAKSDKAAGVGGPAAPKRGVIGRGIDALGPLAPAAGVAGAVVAVKAVADLSDAYTTLQNRLGTVNSTSATTAELSDRLFQVAQNTRSEWGAVSEVFVRTSNALEGLGYSTEQTLQFTETLSKAVKISGASATEANAAMIQLSQGLSSGTLRGDELRSVLEQLPTVADVIAKSLGVTRGELRKLGEDGKISTSAIIDAFAKAKGDIDSKFGKTIPTIGEQITKLKNIAVKFIGDIAPLLAPLIDTLGLAVKAIGNVLRIAGELASIPGKIAAAGSAIDTSKIKYGDFGKVLGEVKSKFSTLNLETVDAGIAIEGTDERAFRLNGQLDAMRAKLEALKPTVNSLSTALQGMKTATALAFAEFARANGTEAKRIIDLKLSVDALRDSVDPAGTAMRKLAADTLKVMEDVSLGIRSADEGRAILEGLGKATTDAIGKAAADAAKKGADAFKALMDRVRGYRDEVDTVGAAQRALAAVQRDLTSAVDRHKISETEAIDIYERKKFQLQDQLDPTRKLIESLKAEVYAGLESNAMQRTAAEYLRTVNDLRMAGVQATNAQTDSLWRLIAAKNADLSVETAAQRAGREGLGQEIKTGGGFGTLDGSVDSAFAKEQERIRKQALIDGKSTIAETESLSQQMATSFSSHVGTMEQAFRDFGNGVQTDFKAMTRAILVDLGIVIAKALILRAINAAFGLGSGGGTVVGPLGSLKIPGFATGGSFSVGGSGGTDRTPVAFMATRGERVIVQTPAQQAAAAQPMMSAPPVVHNNVVFDSRQLLGVLESPGGRRALNEAVRVNAGAFKAALR